MTQTASTMPTVVQPSLGDDMVHPEAAAPIRAAIRSLPAGYPQASDGRPGDAVSAVTRPDEALLLVADARGKGDAAAALATALVTVFEAVAANLPVWNLPRLVSVLDRSVQCAGGDEDFVTAVLARVSRSGALETVACGHPPPVLIRADGSLQQVDVEAALPLGLASQPRTSKAQVPHAGRLLLITDGVTEARDGNGRFFPIEDHSVALLNDDLDAAATDLLGRIVAHSGGTCQDDVTLLLAGH